MSSRAARATLRERLERAQGEVLLTRVRRWIPDSDIVDGYVLDVGRRWAILATQSDQVTPNGWALVRLKDIQAVVLEPIDGGFTTEVLTARGQWPPALPEVTVNLDDPRPR